MQKKLLRSQRPLKMIKNKLKDPSKFTFENKEIKDTRYRNFYSYVVRTLKEVEAEKDCCYTQKKKIGRVRERIGKD